MEADCFSGSCQKIRYLGMRYLGMRCKKSVVLLIVASHVHQGTKIWYLRTIVLGQQESSIEKMAALVFPSNKFNNRWKQTVFSGSCWQNVVPGHEVPVAIEPGSSTTLFEKNVISLVFPSTNLTTDGSRLFFW